MAEHVQATIVQFYSNLETFRVAEKYTDLMIECDDIYFKCHRVTLASASPFFDSIFTATFKEPEKEYYLPLKDDVNAMTLGRVLQFIYSGDVTVTSENICDLFETSKFFSLPGIADRCLEFMKKNKMTVNATLNMYKYSVACQNENLINILSQDIADQLKIFTRSDSFLGIPFHDFKVVLDKLVSSSTSSSENEEALFCAACRWIFHCREKRSIYFDQLLKIRPGGISTEVSAYIFSKLMSSKGVKLALESGGKCISNFTAMPRTTVVSSASLDTQKNKLYVFIKFAEKNPVHIFSIDEHEKCENSGDEVRLKDDSLWIQTTAVDDRHLYILQYVRRNSAVVPDQQSFCVYNSIKMHQSLKLNKPPIVFGDVILCKGRNNNIYAYNQTLFQPIVRTDSRCSTIFNDEEISRGVYLYNADLDVWLPVPAMKRRVEDACLTTYNGSLYLVGGGIGDFVDSSSAKVVQTYDCREGMWQVLPQNTAHNDHVGATCCEYDGKIYVCGGRYQPTVVERYDPSCGKWEILENEMPHQVKYQHLVSYNHKLWSLGSSILDGVPAVNNSLIQSYPHQLTVRVPAFFEDNEEYDLVETSSELYTSKDRWEKELDISKSLEHSEGGVILHGIVF